MAEPFSLSSVLNPASQSSQEIPAEDAGSEQQQQPMDNASWNQRRYSAPHAKPIELLQQIGLMGKEVVRILKDRGWEVRDPKALQHHKVYYVPGGRAKGELAVQGEDFFEGEGELYAFILERGGIRYLLPDESWSSESESKEESDPEFEILEQVPPPSQPTLRQEDTRAIPASTEENPRPTENLDDLQADLSTTASESPDPQPKRKRRKKLPTANGEVTSKPSKRQLKKPRKKSVAGNGLKTAAEQICVKKESIPFVAADGCGRLVEFGAYEAALTARGWRAQLLQDVDLYLLRSVAAISRRQLALEATGGDIKVFSRPGKGARPPESVNTGILDELKVLSSGIKASQNDLSSMVAGIITQAELFSASDRTECAARVGIPGFVSTGSGNLMLLRDTERHLLLIVAAVRQYLRARNASSPNERGPSPHTGERRHDLRALQLNIEKMNAELNELSTIVSAQADHLSRKDTTATPMELDADVETDSEQWLV